MHSETVAPSHQTQRSRWGLGHPILPCGQRNASSGGKYQPSGTEAHLPGSAAELERKLGFVSCHRGESRYSERGSDSPKITQQDSARARATAQGRGSFYCPELPPTPGQKELPRRVSEKWGEERPGVPDGDSRAPDPAHSGASPPSETGTHPSTPFCPSPGRHRYPPNRCSVSSRAAASIGLLSNRSGPALEVTSSWGVRASTGQRQPTCQNRFMAPTVLCAQRCLLNVC